LMTALKRPMLRNEERKPDRARPISSFPNLNLDSMVVATGEIAIGVVWVVPCPAWAGVGAVP